MTIEQVAQKALSEPSLRKALVKAAMLGMSSTDATPATFKAIYDIIIDEWLGDKEGHDE